VPAGDEGGTEFHPAGDTTTDDKRLPAVLANTSGFVYYVSITGITGSAAADSGAVGESRRPASSGIPNCRSVSVSASALRTRRGAIAEKANGAVVGTALVDALKGSLDPEGRATAKTVTPWPIWCPR